MIVNGIPHSLRTAITVGIIIYAVRKLSTGRARAVKPIVWVIAAVFVFRFAWLH